MTDIVEQLRAFYSDPDCLEWKAANEIERLRTLLRAVIDDIHEYERLNNLSPTPPRMECWGSVARARAALA